MNKDPIEPENKISIIQNNGETIGSRNPSNRVSIRGKLTRDQLLNGHAEIPHEISYPTDPRIKSPDELLAKISPLLKNYKKSFPEDPLPPSPEIKSTEESSPPNSTDENQRFGLPEFTPQTQDNVVPTQDQPVPSISNGPLHFGIPDLSSIRQELESERQGTPDEIPSASDATPESPGTALANEPGKFPAPPVIPDRRKNPSGTFSNLFKAQDEYSKLKEKYEKEMSQWKEYAQSVKIWQAQAMMILKTLKDQLEKSHKAQIEITELKEVIRHKDAEILTHHEKGKTKIIDWMKGFGKILPQHDA